MESFLGRVLELDHKPKALQSPYCSQILAHPMGCCCLGKADTVTQHPLLWLSPCKAWEQPQQWGSSCWWYRRGMRNCLGSSGTCASHQSHLHTRGNPTRGEEVTSFLAKYPAPAAACSTSGERWTRLALVCILSTSSAFWLGCALAHKASPQPAKGTFPFGFPSLWYLRRR